MIILPDRNIPKSKFLMPVNKKEWMPSSQAIFKDEFGNDSIRTFFVVKAVLNDGFVKWKGTFFDRDDFDAFLFSIATGTLKYERHLWKLCFPEWHPDIGENLSYEFASFTYITSTSSGLSYTIPTDWDNSNNFIDCIGGGGSGCAFNSTNSNSRASGGGGGAWARRTNYETSPSTVIGYTVATGGAAKTDSAANLTEVGGDSGGGTVFGASVVSATGGGGGNGATNTTASGGAGGSPGGDYTSGFSGGAGATCSASVSNGGGGGAAGPRGRGNPQFTSSGTGSGGTGDGGNTASDSNGTYYSASPAYGAGGGGSGGLSGGTYGAGGGGQRSLNATVSSGAGRQGLIVISYEPYVSRPFFNLPTLGL